MDKPEPIRFTRHEDGCVTAERWPPCVLIAAEFVKEDIPDLYRDLIAVNGDTVVFSAANGSATYEILDRLPYEVSARLTGHEYVSPPECPYHGAPPAPYELYGVAGGLHVEG
jgi:hypothetical protein